MTLPRYTVRVNLQGEIMALCIHAQDEAHALTSASKKAMRKWGMSRAQFDQHKIDIRKAGASA